MAALKKILLAVVIVVAVLAGVGLVLPGHAHVERSAVIDTPRANLFVLVNGYATFQKWSPWMAKDPNVKTTIEGPATGVGAKMSWSGDPKTVGSGSQEIVESRAPETVVTHLEFAGHGGATSMFTLQPEGSGTKATWAFDSDLGMNPMNRYFGLMFDKWIGPDYEKGLANLKQLAEALPKTDIADLKAEVVEVPSTTLAYRSTKTTQDEKAIGAAIGAAYAEIGRFMASQKLQGAGQPPRTINTKWADGEYLFDAAIPVANAPSRAVPATSAVQVKESYKGRAIKIEHKGAYRGLQQTYEKAYAYAALNGLEVSGPSWDEYVSDPGNTPEPDLITMIYLPIR